MERERVEWAVEIDRETTPSGQEAATAASAGTEAAARTGKKTGTEEAAMAALADMEKAGNTEADCTDLAVLVPRSTNL